MKKIKNNKGFTILEMIVSMTVISIMVALASPSFSDFVRNNRIYTSSKVLNSDVSYAKSEGMRGIGNVVMQGIDEDFNNGWRVFIDNNGNNSYDEDDQLLRVQESFGSPLVISTTGQDFISFNSYGENATRADVSFVVCDGRAGKPGRVTSINNAGLVKYAEAVCN